MTVDTLLRVIDSAAAEGIKSLIETGAVTTNQLGQILANSFKQNITSDIAAKIEGNKLVALLKFMENFKERKEEYSEVIRRLMKKNTGVETFNEIIAHSALNRYFKNYWIQELFSENPDALIWNSDTKSGIPVEIKSRLASIVDKIQDFSELIYQAFVPLTDEADVIIQVQLKYFSTEESATDISKEVGEIEAWYKGEVLPQISRNAQYSRAFRYVNVNIHTRITQPTHFVGFPAGLEKVSFTSMHILSTSHGNQIHYIVSLANDYLEKVSRIIIEEGIRRGKNFPPEPRIIVFFSESFGNENFHLFFNEIVERYIYRKKGTMIIGLSTHFTERPNDCKIGFHFLKMGEEIRPLIEPYIMAMPAG